MKVSIIITLLLNQKHQLIQPLLLLLPVKIVVPTNYLLYVGSLGITVSAVAAFSYLFSSNAKILFWSVGGK